MKAVIFSDIHLHNSKPFARILDNGVNSRLQDEMNILQQIRLYCEKEGIKVVFFGGDLFHNGASISPDILTLLIKELSLFQDQAIVIRAIPGQHDSLNASFHGLKPLSDYMDILPDCGVDRLHWGDGLDVWTCYHRRGLENQRQALAKIKPREGVRSIFLGHFLLKEILEAIGVPYANQAVEFSDLPVGADFYFLGDYHPHVYLPDLRVMSVGSTHHHTWGSKNKPPGGFIVMDFDTGEFERVLLKAPMFIEIEADKEPPSNKWGKCEQFPSPYWKENFFRLHVSSNAGREKIMESLDDSWHVEFIFDNVEEEKEVSPDDRPDIQFSMQPYEVITKYLQHKDRDPELAREGMKYVRRNT
jgi:DNA repair exonuclease SbcCD nuclease subunit